MKRKVLAFLLSILMVMGSTAAIIATTVFADYSSSIVVSAENVEVDETATAVTVPIWVTGVTDADDVGAFDIRIGYDAEKLKITKIDTKKCGIKAFAGSQFSPYNPVTNPFVILAWDTSEENLLLDSDAEINDMDFCVVNFAILGDWTGTTTLTVTATARNRADNGTITVSTSNGSVKRGEESAHTHSYTQEVVSNDYLVSAATCISPAVYYKSCTCGEASTTETFTSGEVDSTNHVNTTSVEAQASTCTVAGHAAYTICDDCHTVISGSDAALPLADHTSGDDWAFDGAEHWKTCTECGTIIESTRAAHSGGTATCTDPATCSVCGQSYGEVDESNHSSISEDWSSDETQHWHECGCGNKIGAADHTLAEVVEDAYMKSDATCSGPAVYYKSCSVCGYISTVEFNVGDVNPDNHVGFTQEVVDEQYLVSAATCVSPALYYKSCACGEASTTETFTSGEVDSTNHVNTTDVEAQASTCTVAGHAAYTICNDCHTVISGDNTNLPLADHVASDTYSFSDTEHWKVCTNCGTEIDGTRAAHTGGTATCTDAATCSVCGQSYGEVDENNHVGFTQEVVDAKFLVSAANCQSAAVYYKSCTCGEAGTETFFDGDVDDSNHVGFTQEVVDAKFLVSAANCQSAAVYYKSCTCGEASTTETFTYGEVDLTNHVNTTDVEAQASTCTVAGHAAYTICNDCHTVISGDNADLPLADHVASDTYSSSATEHWKTCVNCGAVIDSTRAAHTGGTATCTDAATCSVCGQSYGDVDENNHVGDPDFWEHNDTQHWKVCTACHNEIVREDHTGGTADCQNPATCEVCDQSYGDVDSTNHNNISEDWSSDETQHWHECGCGNKIDATDHDFAETVAAEYLVSTANCVSPAVYYKSCSVCGAAGTETFTSGEVDSTNHVNTTDVEAQASTCTVAGHAAYTVCNDCHTVISGSNADLPLADHDFAETAAAEYLKSEATCVSPAEYYKSCSVCGAASKETFTSGAVNPDNHVGDSGSWEHNDTQHWKVCTACQNEIVREAHTFGEWELVEKGDQTYRERTCSVCDLVDTELVDKMVSGSGSKYQKGGESGASFSVAAGSMITRVVIDGEEIDPENYEVSDDGTTVTLDPDFLETLEPGDHEIEIYVENPDIEVITVAPGTFTVEEVEEEAESEAGAKEPSKALGDESRIFIWTVAMVLSLAGIAFIVTSRKKQGTIR